MLITTNIIIIVIIDDFSAHHTRMICFFFFYYAREWVVVGGIKECGYMVVCGKCTRMNFTGKITDNYLLIFYTTRELLSRFDSSPPSIGLKCLYPIDCNSSLTSRSAPPCESFRARKVNFKILKFPNFYNTFRCSHLGFFLVTKKIYQP
jgi:hypothetical protein